MAGPQHRGATSSDTSSGATTPQSFADALRTALVVRRSSLRGLSLELAEHGVQVSTPLLAAWRSGARRPTGSEGVAAARALEELLALPTGHLAGWVDVTGDDRGPLRPDVPGAPVVPATGPSGVRLPRRRLPDGLPAPAPASAPAVAVADAAVRRARRALGLEREGLLAVRAVDLVLTLDATGRGSQLTQRTTWVARHDGVEAFPAVHVAGGPVRRAAEVEAVAGCRTGPSYADLAAGVSATSLVLAAPLREGERAETVHRTLLPEDPAARPEVQHRVEAGVERVSLTVAFDPARAPVDWQGWSRDDQERAAALEPGEGVVRLARDDFGPGVVGVRWRW